MKRLVIFLAVICSALSLMSSVPTYTDETLNYRVTYKWGFIQKQAGSANFILRKNPEYYSAKLTARTQPWADRIFMVRDTLSGRMRLGDMAPLLYDKATYEKDDIRHDVLHYTYSGNMVTAESHCERIERNGDVVTLDTVLVATAPATDMLSVYYLVRRLPFDTMKVGTVAKANIFSGKRIESLAVKYVGIEDVKLNGKVYKCYKINFTFTSERLKNSSAPMWAWIDVTGSRVPVKLVGELPIGQIQVLWNDPDGK